MKARHIILFLPIAFAGVLLTPVGISQTAATPDAAPIKLKLPVYHPPGVSNEGVLPVRVAGGSRGAAADGASLETLVPDQLALTSQAQPTLYWYQSKKAGSCELTITQAKVAKPVLELNTHGSTKRGLHCVRLSDYNVNLDPNVVYKWSVSIIVDPDNRSADVIATGVIEYNPAPDDLAKKLETATDPEKVSLYVEGSFWYDALDSISTLINKNPYDPDLRKARIALLSQIGIDGAPIEGSKFKE